MKFDLEERETLINFFNSNPALWNHHLTKYRDWNLRDSLLEKLVEKFRGKFNKDDIKREWHNYKQYTGEKNQVQKSQTQVLVMYIALHGNILAKWNLLMLSVILMPHTFLDRAYTPRQCERKESTQELQKMMRKLNYGNHWLHLWSRKIISTQKVNRSNVPLYLERLSQILFCNMTLRSGAIWKKRWRMCFMITKNISQIHIILTQTTHPI